MTARIVISGREIGPGKPTYIVAEMSANHNQSLETAVKIVRAAKEAGADAIKLQTYTPDTMTLDLKEPPFLVGAGTIWAGRTLYDLYREAYTPWEWHAKLKAVSDEIGIDCFSTPFDATAVDFLETLKVPAYKIASFEIVDLPLIEKVVRTGKPVIMSTGMSTISEIEEAVQAARAAGVRDLALLKCSSAYPAPPERMNLQTIPHMSAAFSVPVGLSDHTLGYAVPVAAVSLGACILEKHFTLSRAVPGPDSSFSLEPAEFKAMVDAVRVAEKSLGSVQYGYSETEAPSRAFRRSLFVVKDIGAGETLTSEHVRSIRPGNGLHPRHLGIVLGRKAARPIKRGTPLDWSLMAD